MEKTIASQKFSEEQIKLHLETRKLILLSQYLPKFPQFNSITYWERLTCIGYNPDLSKLEAVVQIYQATGYSGGLCSTGSQEFVRFFVDYHDGAGFQHVGLASFKAADISNTPPGPQHPLNYMVSIFLDDEAHRKFLSCDKAVLPTIRGVLSWNTPPSMDPTVFPHYGNRLDADIQLKRKPLIIWGDVLKNIGDKIELPHIDENFKLPVIDQPLPPVEHFYRLYKEAGVSEHRTFFTSVSAKLSGVAKVSPDAPTFDLAAISKLGINLDDIIGPIINPAVINNNNANIDYEQLMCVGLNTAQDTLGAVIEVKKSSGFSGNMCTAGSWEHVAFWADWDNNGSYDSYLGTASVNVHDIVGVPGGGLFYNVSLPVDLSKHLKNCQEPNIVRVRAVLSWQSYPSTTNPNLLNYYGNRVDVLVQIRPGAGNGGKLGLNIFDINGVSISNIEQSIAGKQGLAFASSASYPNAAQPFGGVIKLSGMFTGSGPSGNVSYKVQFRDVTGGSGWQDVLDKQTFQIIQGSVQSLVDEDPSTTGGWLSYLPEVPVKAEKLSLLALWNSGSRNGLYELRVLFTTDPSHVTFTAMSAGYVFLDNTNYTVDIVSAPTLNPATTLDIIIDGGDCKFYNKGNIIHGQIKVVDDFFSGWNLDLQPAGHIVPPGTPLSTFITPVARNVSGFTDHGDNGLAFTIDTAYLQSCGYTIRLRGFDRALIGYTPTFSDGSYIFNVTNHYNEKYLGFAVLP
ncbi:MAG TPA: hypothetical protein VM802_07985 [Chitinophaga sp.]|uniref:hypothetical protein n=1 Tax=Chitinophaga sp. TaxID=1869181 RepID=UPI002C6D05DF|nr:hypothetical protein [Chitinophaga sp.]HVI44794.1 hypothetical protein [Chitinophaga sp.]